MSNKKLFVRDADHFVSLYELTGPIDSVVDFLKARKDELLSRHPDAVDIHVETDGGFDNQTLILTFRRPETQVEYNRRKKQRAMAAAKRTKAKIDTEAKERAVYERLKQKFEKKW